MGLNYGIIGNCKSAALVKEDTSIDWFCLPQFDSPSVFAALLDSSKGGHFKINSKSVQSYKQFYLEHTCVLITQIYCGDGTIEITDYMPRYQKEGETYHAPPEMVRLIRPIKGTPEISIAYHPKLEYAVGNTRTYKKNDCIVSVYDEDCYDTLFCYTNAEKEDVIEGTSFVLDTPLYFLLAYNEKLKVPDWEDLQFDFERTKVYWLNWSAKTPKLSRYNKEVLRSALTLKLLTFEKTGAILAAATTSLPETIGEVRNWDYRFCWIRDASMVMKVISRLGHQVIVKKFIAYIIDLIPEKDEKLQIMYGINGQKNLEEKILDHLQGYEGSKPVRIGNAAYLQKQNDIYGILVDAIYFQLYKFPNDRDFHEEIWGIVKNIVWIVRNNWQQPDKGIWEFRNEDRHFVFSKLLCWVAIDRAIKIAEILDKPESTKKWLPLAEEIKADIHHNGWNESIGAYTQSYGSTDLDASVLLMESYGLVDAMDPRYVSTVKAIEKSLCHEGLLYRYKNSDDFGVPTSSFTVCTFWYINSLYKIGEKEKAVQLFDQLLSYSNHLGLFSEDLDFQTKRLLGNFPQAYSHLALIEFAMNIHEDAIKNG